MLKTKKIINCFLKPKSMFDTYKFLIVKKKFFPLYLMFCLLRPSTVVLAEPFHCFHCIFPNLDIKHIINLISSTSHKLNFDFVKFDLTKTKLMSQICLFYSKYFSLSVRIALSSANLDIVIPIPSLHSLPFFI